MLLYFTYRAFNTDMIDDNQYILSVITVVTLNNSLNLSIVPVLHCVYGLYMSLIGGFLIINQGNSF